MESRKYEKSDTPVINSSTSKVSNTSNDSSPASSPFMNFEAQFFKAMQRAAPGSPKQYEQEGVIHFFLLGTNENAGKTKTILTALYESMDVTPQQARHLINGPGGTSTDPKHPMLGSYYFECDYNATTCEFNCRKKTKSFLNSTTKAGGLGLGSGMQDASDEIIQVIEAWRAAHGEHLPKSIKFWSFSRGAVCANLAANDIYQKYGMNLKVDIFAIDPVPGPMQNAGPKEVTIPPNVTNCMIILMDGERRQLFVPFSKHRIRPQGQKIIYRILKGPHSYAERFSNDPLNNQNLGLDSGFLLWDFAHEFAKKVGLKLNRTVPFSYKQDKLYFYVLPPDEIKTEFENDRERLNAYTRMVLQSDHYNSLSTTGVDSKIRTFTERKRDYFLHGTQLFQDRYHLELFKSAYPSFFDYFFQNHKSKSNLPDVIKDINSIRENKNLLQFLCKTGDASDTQRLLCNLLTIDENEVITCDNNAECLTKNGVSILPHGIPLILDDFETNAALVNLWEASLMSVFPVFSDHDTSISKNEANKFIDRVYQELIVDRPIKDTIVAIQDVIKNAIIHYYEKPSIAFRLRSIFASDDPLPNIAEDLLLYRLSSFYSDLNQPSNSHRTTHEEDAIIADLKKCAEDINLIKANMHIDLNIKTELVKTSLAQLHDKAIKYKSNSIFSRIIKAALDDYFNPRTICSHAIEVLIKYNHSGKLLDRNAERKKLRIESALRELQMLHNKQNGNNTITVKTILSNLRDDILSFDQNSSIRKTIDDFIFNLCIFYENNDQAHHCFALKEIKEYTTSTTTHKM